MVALPLAAPADWGKNVTYKFALCCGAKVIGKFGPAKRNSLPLTVTWVMVRFDLLVLLTGKGTEFMLPT